MTPEAAREAAALLRAARRFGKPLQALPEQSRPQSVAEGHAVQAAFLAGPSAEDGPLEPKGFKLACTSAKAQAALATDGPFYGRLLADRLFESPAEVSAGDFLFRLVEPEFAFRLGRDLPRRGEAYGEAEVAAAVADLLPAIEIVSSAFGEAWWQAGAPSLAADNAVHGALVLGAPVPDWRDLDLPGHAVRLAINGETVSEGRGANALGGPLTALTWLANALRSEASQTDQEAPTLRAGDLITTGVVTGFELVGAGDDVVADFGDLGRVTLRFVV